MRLRPPTGLFKTLLAALLLTLLFSLSRTEPALRLPPDQERIMIRAQPLDTAEFRARRTKRVALRFEAAWRLTSDHPDFGGLSAISPYQGMLMAVSDSGALFNFSVLPGQQDWPARIAPLPKGCMASVMKADRDSESLAVDPHSGRYWIGLESRNAICSGASGERGRLVQPAAMAKWKLTSGPEAMARLADGRFLVIAEQAPTPSDTVPALLFDHDPVLNAKAVRELRYRPPAGYAPVDVAALPDGRLLILHRAFRLPFEFSAVLSLGQLTEKDGRWTLMASPIAWFRDGRGRENWEALAVEDQGQGRATIWMASDDNYLVLQSTYVLKLAWQGPSRPQ